MTNAAQDLHETDIVAGCLQVLKLRGVFAWRQNQGAMKKRDRDGSERTIRFTSINGVSDIIGVLPGRDGGADGRFLAVECKRPGNVPSEDQKDFLDAVRRRGGVALVIYDAEDLGEIIDSLLRGRGSDSVPAAELAAVPAEGGSSGSSCHDGGSIARVATILATVATVAIAALSGCTGTTCAESLQQRRLYSAKSLQHLQRAATATGNLFALSHFRRSVSVEMAVLTTPGEIRSELSSEVSGSAAAATSAAKRGGCRVRAAICAATIAPSYSGCVAYGALSAPPFCRQKHEFTRPAEFSAARSIARAASSHGRACTRRRRETAPSMRPTNNTVGRDEIRWSDRQTDSSAVLLASLTGNIARPPVQTTADWRRPAAPAVLLVRFAKKRGM